MHRERRRGRLGHAHQHPAASGAHRPAGQRAGNTPPEIERDWISPVQILEHQHRRPVRGQPLQEPPPGRERLLLRRRLRRSPHQRRQPRQQPGPILLALTDSSCELRRRLLRRIGLQDPALRLHDLPQRPEGDPFPVGQTATLPPGDQARPLLDMREQLATQAALPHPRRRARGPVPPVDPPPAEKDAPPYRGARAGARRSQATPGRRRPHEGSQVAGRRRRPARSGPAGPAPGPSSAGASSG